MVVIGGDGTLLRASKIIIQNPNIVVFAVNAGSLGFLTEIKVEEFEKTFSDFLKGDVIIEERDLLEVEFKGRRIEVLNEVVLSKEKATSKILQISLSNSKAIISKYKADGIIVATPTGSTAYSLSAGGPIIMPEIKGLVITPIAPHNLRARPIVTSESNGLFLSLLSEENGVLIVDGEENMIVERGDCVKIGYSKKKLKLVLPKNRDYYSILRDKLKWGDNLC